MSNKHSEKSEVKEVKKSRWSGKTKIYVLVLVAGLGLTVFGLYRKNDKGPVQTAENTDVPEVKTEEQKDVAGNYLDGVLNNTDNPELGNYKLSSKDADIYLRTGRDFSKLLGLQVVVLINGTKDKFELLDIKSKVADDNYILPK